MPDESLQADLLAMLGSLYLKQDQAPRAREAFTRALEIYKRTGPLSEQMRVLVSLGQLAATGRQNALAISQYEQALTFATELGDRLAQARLHGRLGQLLQAQRDTIGALEHYRRAVDAAEALNNRGLIERSLMALATAQHAIGDSAAMSTYRRVLNMVQESGHPDRAAMIHYNMGLLDVADGDTSSGLKHLYRASDILADADLLDSNIGDAVEDAIISAGGRTLARGRYAASRDEYEDEIDEYDDYDEREDERWEPGETWRDYGDQLDYPPDEVFGETTLPPQ
jgi:tetratricopeptide (TPR) repeat protein